MGCGYGADGDVWRELLSRKSGLAAFSSLALHFGFLYQTDDEVGEISFWSREQSCGVGPEDVGGESQGPILGVVSCALDVAALVYLAANDPSAGSTAYDGSKVFEYDILVVVFAILMVFFI